jgi:hypothetical protein
MPTYICHPHSFLWFMCCRHAVIIPYSFILEIYVLRTCRDYLFECFTVLMPCSFLWFMCCEHAVITCLNILFAFILFLVIYVLRTCHDYLFECLSLWYKNVIKIHFAMKTLKKVNMVMWTLETKLVQPKGNGWPWLLVHHGMSLLHGGVVGTCFRVRNSTRSNSHRIIV